jgi:hypothetical protein
METKSTGGAEHEIEPIQKDREREERERRERGERGNTAVVVRVSPFFQGKVG